MTCLYSTDFLSVGGFDDYLLLTESSLEADGQAKEPHFQSSWGGEDVLLYRKLLQSNKVNVIRSVDPGIVHLWHQKDCDKMKFQKADQMRSCLSSKAVNEASQIQLAQALADLKLKENHVK